MSIQAISWALAQKIPSSGAKFVLVALANYADEHNRCWPSQEKIGEDTSMSARSVRTHLASLEAWGWIRRDARQRADGTFASDAYELQIHRQDFPAAESSAGESSGIRVVTRKTPAEKSAVGKSRQRRTLHDPAENSSGLGYPTGNLEPSVEPSSPAAAASGAKSKTKPRPKPDPMPPGWTNRLAKVWAEEMGGDPPAGPIAKHLRPLVKKHGLDEVEDGFRRYLKKRVGAGEGQFASPADFGQRYGYWKEHGHRMPNGNGRHRTTEPQRYEPGIQDPSEVKWTR